MSNTFSDGLNITSGKVGIGTSSPSSAIEIEGSSGDLILEIDNNAANSANFQIQNGAGNARADLVLDNNLHITMKGQRVGILNSDPSYTLDVLGDGRFVGNSFEIENSSGDLVFEMDNNAATSSNFQIQNGAGNARADLILDSQTHITLKGQRVGIVQTNPAYTLDVTGNAQVTTDVTVGGSVSLKEKAAAIADTAAYGQLWVKTATPNELYFTDDAGTDVQIVTAGAVAGGGGGGGISSVETKTGDYTADTDDDVILCNAAALTITLPAVSGNKGQTYYIKNIHATGVVTIDADGSETIDGDLQKYITTQYESLTLVCTEETTPDWAIV